MGNVKKRAKKVDKILYKKRYLGMGHQKVQFGVKYDAIKKINI